ncbi:tetraspanin-33b isoform X2 [Corythoichthys intestinalis]|uniref:tetraspanin-33b isoform X2 n=1 Tax=Corythoichthys intestinalis TaxID=161448 RepID=UPI0025A6461C|nr:tetraspanin-33b isoform X2 [Corythoichthys intestinalis]
MLSVGAAAALTCNRCREREKKREGGNDMELPQTNAGKVFSLLIVAIGVYAKVQKATDTVQEAFLIEPSAILILVGVVMFFITFCGCIGALRENIDLLKTVTFITNVSRILFSFSLTLVFLTQLLIAILAFFYSEQTHDNLGRFVKKGIKHYKDDLDLQNMMDSIQKECCGWNNYTDWSWNMYFNCTENNPSTERCAVPFSCCASVPKETVVNTLCGAGVQNLDHLEVDKSIYPVGCADRAVSWIESHLLLVGALALGLALPQIAGIVLSQILISQIREEITSVS